MKIAVTGASGYVGSRITESLRGHGHDVLALSRRQTAAPWHSYSLSDPPESLPWNQLDALIHAAHDFTARTPEQNELCNIKPSIRLFDAAHAAGLRHLIYISSMSAFDGCASNYGKSKLAVETHILNLGGVALRPGLVWGDKPGGVMGALERLVQHLPIIPCLVGPDGLPQHLIHETDLCEVLLETLGTSQPPAASVLHVANPDRLTIKQILTRIAARHRLHRLFIPVPWQLAMIALKCAEAIHLPIPFRSDSLVGLVHGTASLQNEEHSVPPKTYQSFS